MTTIQSTPTVAAPVNVESPAKVTREGIAQTLAANPRKMTSQLARELGIPEVEVIRALPADQVTEMDASRWMELIERFPDFGKTHVIVNSPSATLEVNGEFGKFSRWMGYFNVQTPSLDMHIREDGVASVFAVAKLSHMDGVPVLSFQFYGPQGHSAFKVFLSFGGKETSPERQQLFNQLKSEFALSAKA